MLERINPAGLARPQTYTHVVVATGSRLVFVAGQVAEDVDGTLVGDGELRLQAPAKPRSGWPSIFGFPDVPAG